MTPRTLKELAQEALDVQDTVNPLGISKSFAVSLQELHDRLKADGLPTDTASVCRHPIYRLWASKLHALAEMGMSDWCVYGKAEVACQQLVETPEPPNTTHKYRVTLQRVEFQRAIVEVEAENEEEANQLACEEDDLPYECVEANETALKTERIG